MSVPQYAEKWLSSLWLEFMCVSKRCKKIAEKEQNAHYHPPIAPQTHGSEISSEKFISTYHDEVETKLQNLNSGNKGRKN